MSGIFVAAAGGVGSVAPPPSGLTAQLGWNIGSPYNVAGATGTTPTNSYTYSATGGTPPYTFSNEMIQNPSGKIDVVAVSNSSGPGQFAIFYQNFAVNESQSGRVKINVTDSLGATSFALHDQTIKRTS
ncbi:hypothetical protein [Sphingomonas sp.]|uniref:hypothetical protein n=1 Tax=Sphingomonas sp. TaxID=28214 RepID=UPI003B3A2E3E